MRLSFCPRTLGRYCWRTLAVTLVLFALMVSLIRGLLPQLDEAKQQLADYVEREYGVEVKIGNLSARWQAFGPALTVEDLVLPPQERLPVTLMIDKVDVKLDFWQSLMTAGPQVEDVIFDGVQLALDLDHLGQKSTATLDAESKPAPATNIDWLYALLLEQLDRFSIRDASVQLLSSSHDYRPIHLRDLSWHNSGKLHQGSGALYLDELATATEQLTLRLDLKGDGYKPDSIKGQAYLQAQSLDLGKWASRQPNPYDPQTKLPLEGVINLEAWIEFANRGLKSGVIKLLPSWLRWSLRDEPQKFAIDGGVIAWQPIADGWRLDSSELKLATNDKPWPKLEFHAMETAGELYGKLNELQLDSLLPLLPLVPGMPLEGLRTWQQLKPEGKLGPLAIYRPKEGALQAKVALERVNWQPAGSVPGSTPIDLSLGWRNNFLSAALPAQDYKLDFGDGFKAPLSFRADAFELGFSLERQALMVPALHLGNDDISLDASMRLLLADKPHLALSSRVKLLNAANAGRYFPRHAMGESLADYLEGAIKAGRSDDAAVVWHGELAGFPYQDHSGVFQAGFNLTHAEYAFQPDWPAVTDLSLKALFENARMDLWVNKGKLLNVAADGAHVYIPKMDHRSLLRVEAQLATQGQDATEVLQRSPLRDSVGITLNVVQVQGPVSGKLDLSIPLYDGEEAQILGDVQFAGVPVYIREPGVLLDKVSGKVSFHNEVVKGEGLSASLFGQPLQFGFDTGKVNQNMGLNARLKGQWNLANLPSELDNPLSDFYQGALDWQGNLKLIFDEIGYRIQANVNANLKQTELLLPPPYQKASGQALTLKAELLGDNKTSSLGVRLGDKAEFWGGFDADSGKGLKHYDLLLGRLYRSGDQLQKQDGHLRLALDEVDFAQWQPLINAFIGGGNHDKKAAAESQNSAQAVTQAKTQDETQTESTAGTTSIAADKAFFPPLKGIEARVKQLELLGQRFTELQLSARPGEHAWQIEGLSPEFSGRVEIYPDWYSQGLKLVASRLYLNPIVAPAAEPESKAQSEPEPETNLPQDSDLPPLAVEVDDFRYQDMALGRLLLQANPSAAGYQIQTLALSSDDARLQGKGEWLSRDGNNRTQVELNFKGDRFDLLATRLGLDPGVKDSPLEVKAELNWLGAPLAFNLESLSGKVRFDLGKGHIEQLSDKGARIFSLFSLDSLLRKLSLDFTDVFGKGLYYNSFGGDLTLENGVLKTTNTEMDAIAGNMKVRGYTDLVTESLNYDIRFVPQLASSVPTVVLLSTSAWTMGLGAFALTKVLEPVIEIISEIRFRLTGTMSDPKLEELERKSKEIEIPESVLPRQPKSAPGKVQTQVQDDEPAATDAGQGDQAKADNKAKVLNSDQERAVEEGGAEAEKPLPQTDKVTPLPLKSPSEPKTEVPVKQGVEHASQSATVSELPRAGTEPAIYRLAA
ncbi:YhdP family protein [Shewanella chilikensis]|uniref:YhdP family protein n=1 Tax=Shewanella chilikensis TaxID=558541 RepID=UPI001F48F390|nr:YhdP family protein [Shewanella chilikensis]MCE9787976.1 TIGR02099 family protein [Shewanella chilikensis]